MAVAGRVLMIPAGAWKSGTSYGMLDVVIHGGSSYVAKKQINNSTVVPPNAAADWQLLAQGFDATNVLTKSMIANNFLATDPNTVLSGPMGKSLKDQLDEQNSNLIVSGGDINITGSNFSAGIIYYQNVGRTSILTFGGLQFTNSFSSGSTIKIITLNNGSWPLVTTKSVMVCQNIPLYLTITTAGEIVLANYSGINVPAGAIAEGQVTYVTS